MKFRLRTLLILVAISACLAFFVSSIYRLQNAIKESQRGNTIGWIAKMTVAHMEANNGRLPENWDDLRDDYISVVCEFGQPWQFEELRSNVQFDWNTSSTEILTRLKNGDRTVRLLRMQGTPPHLDREIEANGWIIEYIENSDNFRPTLDNNALNRI